MSADKRKKEVRELPVYEDPFQDFVEEILVTIKNNRQILTTAGLAVLGITLVGSIVYFFMEYRMNTAQKALSGALEIYNSPVVAANSPEAKESKKKTYTDEKEKYKQAAQAFETVANSYSVVGSLARYYAAISRSHFDPPKAQTELEAISKETSEIGTWAKVSLAESYAANEQVDKAIAIYQQIKDGNATLPKTLVLYSLGRLYERQSKTNEATEAYVQTATADRNSSEGRKAIERLNIIAPEKVKNLPPEKADDEWFK